MAARFNNIVIMRTDRIGEVLIAASAVDRIKKDNPEANITFITSGYSRPLVEGRMDIAEVVVVDTVNKRGWLRRAILLSRFLKRKNFDLAIVLNPHKLLHLACFLAKVPCRLGYRRKWGFLLTHGEKDQRHKGEKHEVEYVMDLLEKVGIKSDDEPSVSLVFDKDAQRAVKTLLGANSMSMDRPIIAIHPSASNEAKMWGKDRFRELVKKLSSEKKVYVCVIGDRHSRRLAEEIIHGEDHSIVKDFTGMFDLKQLSAFLSKCSVLVTNDSGPMHMAAALGTPVVAIFGRNISGVSPARWRPWGKGHVVLHKGKCVPCLDTKCRNGYKCFSEITVGEVFNKVTGLLERVLPDEKNIGR